MLTHFVFKAGDVVSYYDPILGRRRVEHYDHADNSGRHAALNMTGARKAYNYMPMFWGAMNGTPYEAVGLIDSRLDTVGVWQKGMHRVIAVKFNDVLIIRV